MVQGIQGMDLAVHNGHDLKGLGLMPGPAMKPLLAEAYELQLEGQFKSQADALAWARQKLSRRPS